MNRNHPTRMRILLADDDADYRHTLRPLLELEGYEVIEANSVDEAKSILGAGSIDLALLDLRLTEARGFDVSGLDVARSATERGIRCVIITAYDTSDTARLALRSRGGEPLAEDYVPKKAGPEAVLDAIATILQKQKVEKNLTGGLRVDFEKKLVFLNGSELPLYQQQYNLLAHLYQQAGVVCSPEELIDAVYNQQLTHREAISDKRLERLIARLRKKIEKDPANPQILVSVPGRGYRLIVQLEQRRTE